MLSEILSNLETYKRSEVDFRLDSHLYKIGIMIVEGLRDKNFSKVNEARNMLEEVMSGWEKKNPKGRVRLYTSFLVFTISFISVVSRRRIKEIARESDILEDDDRLVMLIDFVDAIVDMCSGLYDRVKKYI